MNIVIGLIALFFTVYELRCLIFYEKEIEKRNSLNEFSNYLKTFKGNKEEIGKVLHNSPEDLKSEYLGFIIFHFCYTLYTILMLFTSVWYLTGIIILLSLLPESKKNVKVIFTLDALICFILNLIITINYLL